MRLFSYLAGDQAAPARQVGALGVDIRLAVDVYRSAHPGLGDVPPENADSLLDWLSLGSEGMALIQKATDWILDQPPEGNGAQPGGIIFDFDTAQVLAPIPHPGKVICIAGNYPAPGAMEKPPFPTVFLKPSGGVTGNRRPILIPPLAQNVAYEVELAVVIGSRGRHLSIAEAMTCVAGCTIGNDLGDRVIEKRTSQWTSGKMFDTFTPLGPVLVTRDELPEPHGLEMVTRVNGVVVQHGSTAQMFFGVPELVSMLSELTTLQPGDVILTGSPKLMGDRVNPVVAVKPGDLVEVSVEKLGTLSNPALAEEQASL